MACRIKETSVIERTGNKIGTKGRSKQHGSKRIGLPGGDGAERVFK